MATSKALGNARRCWPFAGLLLAGIVANFGNALAAVVYPWLVYDLTGNTGAMGVIAAIGLLPAILGMAVGGAVAERIGIRRIALISVTMGAFASFGIAIAFDADVLTIALLAVLTLLGALLDGPGGVAIEARVPEIARLARLSLIRANAIDDLLDNAAAVAGPAAAAILVALTSTTVLLWAIALINATAVVLVALSLPRFRLRQPVRSTAHELGAALRLVAGAGPLRTVLVLAGIGTGVFVAFQTVALPAILRTEGRSAALLGMFLAAASSGAITVNLLLSLLRRTPSLRTVFATAFLGLAAGVALLAFDRSGPTLIASGVMLGLAAGPLSPVFATLLQSSTPKDMRANVIGLSMSLLLVSAPFATVAAGMALEAFKPESVLLACAAMLIACAIAALGLPQRSSPK